MTRPAAYSPNPPIPPTPSVQPPPSGGSRPAPKPPPANAGKDAPSSVKETLESILVAFILAFIFRAFVVEAFVIPTGSMAPTLLGAHMRFTCPDCGYQFDVNYSPKSNGDDMIIPSSSSETYRVFCPNCGFKLPESDVTQPPVHYGDRILVLKYLYLMREPQRWDVVVFKSPASDDEIHPPTYQQNFIKRLIGKPNESVMILDGDIYIGQPGQDRKDYTIQTKPRWAQEALWRVIYDNDYHPQQLSRADGSKWTQPWQVADGTGWDTNAGPGGREFVFSNTGGSSTLFFNRNAVPIFDRRLGPHPYAFSDFLAYDAESELQPYLNFGQMNMVRDLKLRFAYSRKAGDGALRVRLTSENDQFIAVLTPTEAKLYHKVGDDERQVGSPMAMPSGTDPVTVELVNADYQATLRINDQIVAQTTPAEYHPKVASLLNDYDHANLRPPPKVEIEAANQQAALSHIGLWRDIYYINRDSQGRVDHGTPKNIMHLNDDEYFVLGDNSLISGDARYWEFPIQLPADQLDVRSGIVPGRFLLGRAFFVYWPAGFRPGVPIGIAPNFGDMRFIR